MNKNIAIIKRYGKRREKCQKIFDPLLCELTAFINLYITALNQIMLLFD